jgi:hypothetical protein
MPAGTRSAKFGLCRGLAVLVVIVAHGSRAHAEDAGGQAEVKAACVQHYEATQLLRRDGRLLEAREAARACAAAACPALVQGDCSQWFAEIEHSVPSIVLSARSEHGDELDVRVLMDGALLATHLDGKAVEIDPGQHLFRFERAPYAPVETTYLVSEGEKARPISVSFAPTHPAPPRTPIVAPVVQATPREVSRPVPTVVWVLSGVSLVGFGAMGYFGASAIGEKNDLSKTCAPFCTDDEMSGLRSRMALADVSLGVGVVAAGAALVFYVTRPSVDTKPEKHASWFALRPSASGANLRFGSEF